MPVCDWTSQLQAVGDWLWCYWEVRVLQSIGFDRTSQLQAVGARCRRVCWPCIYQSRMIQKSVPDHGCVDFSDRLWILLKHVCFYSGKLIFDLHEWQREKGPRSGLWSCPAQACGRHHSFQGSRGAVLSQIQIFEILACDVVCLVPDFSFLCRNHGPAHPFCSYVFACFCPLMSEARRCWICCRERRNILHKFASVLCTFGAISFVQSRFSASTASLLKSRSGQLLACIRFCSFV